MKKQSKIIIFAGIISILILGVLVYWQFRFNNNINSNISNINTNIDNTNQQNTGEIDTSNWVTFEDKTVGFSFKYPGDKYSAESLVLQNGMVVVDTIKNKEDGQNVARFYSHKPGYDIARSLFFGDVAGYTNIDGKYDVVYFNDKKEVDVIDKLSNVIGDIIIIDGTKFDYSGPSIGPGSKYAAIVNLSNNEYSGIAILPNDQILDYGEFLLILKSITKLKAVDTSNWVNFEDKDLGISYKHPADCYQNGAGPGSTATNAVGCGISFMMYGPINYSYNANTSDNFKGKSFDQIAEDIYTFNKNKLSSGKFISDGITKNNINGYEAYQFVVDSTFYSIPCDVSPNGACGIGGVSSIEGKKTVILIENKTGDKILSVMVPYNDPISEKILSTLTFTNQVK